MVPHLAARGRIFAATESSINIVLRCYDVSQLETIFYLYLQLKPLSSITTNKRTVKWERRERSSAAVTAALQCLLPLLPLAHNLSLPIPIQQISRPASQQSTKTRYPEHPGDPTAHCPSGPQCEILFRHSWGTVYLQQCILLRDKDKCTQIRLLWGLDILDPSVSELPNKQLNSK